MTYNKVWVKPDEKPQSYQSCIIFDWDDTILCTTFITPHQRLIFDESIPFPPALAERLDELDKVACELLQKAKKLGKTYIVTNAAEGWV